MVSSRRNIFDGMEFDTRIIPTDLRFYNNVAEVLWKTRACKKQKKKKRKRTAKKRNLEIKQNEEASTRHRREKSRGKSWTMLSTPRQPATCCSLLSAILNIDKRIRLPIYRQQRACTYVANSIPRIQSMLVNAKHCYSVCFEFR